MSDIDLTEAIDAAWDALHDDGHNGYDCRPDRPLDVTAERVLRGALPHLEQQIRESVAQDIEAMAKPLATGFARKIMRHAALIARTQKDITRTRKDT